MIAPGFFICEGAEAMQYLSSQDVESERHMDVTSESWQ